MSKTFIIVLVLVLVLGGVYFMTGKNSKLEAPVVENESMEEVDSVTNEMPVVEGTTEMSVEGEGMNSSKIKEFTVEGGKFYFSPNTISVKKGDTVKITFKNVDGFHDFKLDEFNVATKQFQSPGEEIIEFVADKTGNFEYYCSVGSHRTMGMKGSLSVTE